MRKESSWFCQLLLVLGLQLALGELADICSQEADGSRLPLSSHCGRFVVCQDREVAFIGSCPRGLHFNRVLGECDFQWRANCLGLSAFATSDDKCTCSCCADECNDLDLDVDDDNNDNGKDDVETTTPCAPDDKDDTTVPTATDDPEITTTPSSATTDDSISSSTTPAGKVPAYCSDGRADCANKTDGDMLPIDGECGKFIQCAHGCVQEFSCPGSLFFDPKYNLCNHAYMVDCIPAEASGDETDDDVIVGPSGTTCSNQSVCAKQPDGKMFANPDTNGYLVCQCQCPIAMPCDEYTKFNETAQVCDWDWDDVSDANATSDVTCPGDLVYNATSNECDYPVGYVPVVVCNSTSTICQNQTEGTLFPVNGTCNKFYKCNFNCAVEQDCPNNLIYDSSKKMCDYPQNVNCEWDYVPPSGETAGPSGIACESNGRCLGEREGTYLPSVTSCNNYVVCQCECEVEMSCSDGLYWDNVLRTCNYPEKVVCKL
ncbi:chondroitin proteoglycan 2 [Drosophila tropicalis]|uniref:chondroitin proteoglycan 2 n=1 Tax=Drosophila tropicalis TaxID=46794 RepID=UPI0035ABE9B8